LMDSRRVIHRVTESRRSSCPFRGVNLATTP
jgi:hypothetical protein